MGALQNCLGWKRPRGSSRPTVNPAQPGPPPNPVTKCHIYTLSISRDADSITYPGSLFQCFTTLSSQIWSPLFLAPFTSRASVSLSTSNRRWCLFPVGCKRLLSLLPSIYISKFPPQITVWPSNQLSHFLIGNSFRHHF